MDPPRHLFNRNFVLLWQGQFVSQLGSQAFTIAAMFWLKHTTGSATLMGTLMMVSMLPLVVLSPFGGTLADRHSRRGIIIVCDLIHGVVVVSLAVLLFLRPENTGAIIVWLVVVSAVSGVVTAFFMPAIKAAVPAIVPVERVAAANSINEGSFQISTLVGQGIGGVLFRILGAPVLFLIDGLTFLYSALSEGFITIPQIRSEGSAETGPAFARFRAETAEGLRWMWSRAGMRNMFFASAALNFFAVPFLVLFPFYVEDVLLTTPDWYGFLLAAYGGGSLLGYIAAGALKLSGRTRGRVLLVLLFVVSGCLCLLGLVSTSSIALALMAVAGIVSGVFNISVITLIQTGTPDELRGRMFGLLNTLVMGLTPISMGLAGVVTDLVDQNVTLVFLCCGAMLIVVTTAVSFSREYREFLSSDPVGTSPL